jgi:hypothetical protein
MSPLFIGPQGLDASRLDVLSRRLRDILVGDVVRGIQIGLEATATPTGQVGALRAVKIQWFQADSVLGDFDQTTYEDRQDKGLWIDIRHENASYTALLLPSTASAPPTQDGWAMQPDEAATGVSTENPQFLHLPLLLLRMPLALKQVVGDWLAATFDCRVNKLTLGTKTIVNAWETWLQEVGVPQKSSDVAVTLAFNAPLTGDPLSDLTKDEDKIQGEDEAAPAGLRSVEIIISPQDLRRFARLGKSLPPQETGAASPWDRDLRERRRLAGANADDGWAWRMDKDTPKQPFTDALARYLDHHLALNLFHPSVRVVQISCSGFVLAQSRLKIIKVGDLNSTLSMAAWKFVAHLGERVRGDEIPSLF